MLDYNSDNVSALKIACLERVWDFGALSRIGFQNQADHGLV